MALLSEISLSKIEEFNRMDSEFYRNEYLIYTEKLKNISGVRLSSIAKITDGIHESPQLSKSGVKYISAKCVKDNEFVTDNCLLISRSQHLKNQRTELQEGDVIITSVGTIGNTAVVERDILPCNSDRHVGIIRIKDMNDISPYYLSTFLNSKYGRYQSLREATGNVQLNLYVRNIGLLIIPRNGLREDQIAAWTKEGYILRNKSKELYSKAQSLLDKSLGLDQLNADTSIYSISSFNNVSKSHRLDAQHYQAKFKSLINHLSKFPCKIIKDIRTHNRRGVQPYYTDNGTIDIVNSQHIGKKHLKYDSMQKTSEEFYKRFPEGHIKENDLLIYTTGAYIGQTNIFLKKSPALASNHVNILRVTPEVDPGYVGMILQSIIGKYQTEMHLRGSAQFELYPSDIDKFIIPMLPKQIQSEIGDLVRKSLHVEIESKNIIEQAKKRIEDLIEGGI